MTKIHYDMLVRDNYPTILERPGKKKCTTAKIADADFMNRLTDKLEECVDNFSREYDAENDEKALFYLADIEDIVDCLIGEYGMTSDAFQRIRDARKALYGDFHQKTLLVSVEDVE